MSAQKFPGKILLFGEHAVVIGGSGFAIPWSSRYAQWKMGNNAFRNRQLKQFAAWLGDMHPELFELDKLQSEIAEGLYLESDIPEGYGAGSSGSLCVAVVSRFGSKEWQQTDPAELRKKFAAIESYFHGKSSGLDPLVIYLNRGIRFKGESINEVNMLRSDVTRMYLIDTGISRKTSPLVQLFRISLKKDQFREAVDAEYLPANEDAVEAFLSGETEELVKAVQRISSFQIEHMSEWIPEQFTAPWQAGLDTDSWYLKLCGAGGGGYLLAIIPPETDPKTFEQYFYNKYTSLVYSS